jgi:hypothetical protein
MSHSSPWERLTTRDALTAWALRDRCFESRFGDVLAERGLDMTMAARVSRSHIYMIAQSPFSHRLVLLLLPMSCQRQ